MASGSRWPDRIVTAAVILLMGASPLAFGGVHRAAFTTLEAIAFVAFAAWMAKVWHERPAPLRLRIPGAECRRLGLPAEVGKGGEAHLKKVSAAMDKVLGL